MASGAFVGSVVYFFVGFDVGLFTAVGLLTVGLELGAKDGLGVVDFVGFDIGLVMGEDDGETDGDAGVVELETLR